MTEKQVKQYYERIEKLLNGTNKEAYGFAPEEIRQILKSYEELQQRIYKAIHLVNHNDILHYRIFEEKLLEILEGNNN